MSLLGNTDCLKHGAGHGLYPAAALQPSSLSVARPVSLPSSLSSPVPAQVIVHTSSVAGGGTAGNVFIDMKGEGAPSGVLTLRNRGGSFRPGQVSEALAAQ